MHGKSIRLAGCDFFLGRVFDPRSEITRSEKALRIVTDLPRIGVAVH